MEERFLHAWDELDDWIGLCRHLATQVAGEMLAGSGARAAAVAGALAAGMATTLMALKQFLDPSA